MTFIMGRDTFKRVLAKDGKAVAVLRPGDDLMETIETLKVAAKEAGAKGITIEAATNAQLRVVVEATDEEPRKKSK